MEYEFVVLRSNFKIITAREDPELVDRATAQIDENWPEFMLHDPVANNFSICYRELPDYQFILQDKTSGQLAAICNTIPVSWSGDFNELPDTGWDWVMTLGIDDLEQGRQTRTLSALQIVVFKKYRGQGLSSLAVECMRQLAREHGFHNLIAPVRPTLKSQYPLIPIENYITWKNDKGRPFDHWLRVHYNVGGQIVKSCRNSMQIDGTAAQWEKWTGIRFPENGLYIIPGALVPVNFDTEKDLGTYIEPNVWVVHSLL